MNNIRFLSENLEIAGSTWDPIIYLFKKNMNKSAASTALISSKCHNSVKNKFRSKVH